MFKRTGSLCICFMFFRGKYLSRTGISHRHCSSFNLYFCKQILGSMVHAYRFSKEVSETLVSVALGSFRLFEADFLLIIRLYFPVSINQSINRLFNQYCHLSRGIVHQHDSARHSGPEAVSHADSRCSLYFLMFIYL